MINGLSDRELSIAATATPPGPRGPWLPSGRVRARIRRFLRRIRAYNLLGTWGLSGFLGSHLQAIHEERLARYRLLRIASMRISVMLRGKHGRTNHPPDWDCPVCSLDRALVEVRLAESAALRAMGRRR